ncbi:Alcohol dehydrogenase [hydrothermal vent metagenome]|uniref:Alcohol dehydrogenase n=1 Tax=hydrothermal vent metagenome TaxID=652676 RepID=A0A3B0SJC2_9ZZZZ
MQMRADWSYPTSIRFGAGRIDELADVCASVGMRRPLLVTDPVLAKFPMIEDALSQCRAASLGVALFSDLKPNPTGANIDAGAKIFRDGGHDGVIAFGGGSAIDCGKAIAFLHGQSRVLWDYEDVDDWWRRADSDAIAPVIAVPTTAGTGSEVGRASVIVREATLEKKIIFHPRMMPVCVICDPQLTVGMPPVLTAGVGLDAFAHCLEAYCAPIFHPQSEGIAIEGMRLVKDALGDAVKDGANIEARAKMLAAASMGAVAFQKGLGAIHSLSHPIGALYDTHHGMTNAVIMPYALAFNRKAIEEKIERLSAFLGIDGKFDGLMKWLIDLRSEINVPHTLKDFGVDDAQVQKISEMAAIDPTAATNPVKLDAAGAREIFEAAYTGRL